MSAAGAPRSGWVSWVVPLLIGVIGAGAALGLPFAPVWTSQTALTWPAPGAPAVSSTAFLAPYRPLRFTATVPCSALRAGAARASATTVLATAGSGQGLLVRVGNDSVQVFLNAGLVDSESVTGPGCGLHIDAGPTSTSITTAAKVVASKGPPPVVQILRTELHPDEARGLNVTARTASVFAARSGGAKKALIAIWAFAAALALGWLWLRGRSRNPDAGPPNATAADHTPATAAALTAEKEQGMPTGTGVGAARWQWAAAAVDVGVCAVLGLWAVIGPLADDDGFVAMIARNSRIAGYAGNYYRWWNASEAPFALAQHLLTPLTEVSLSPLWLRMPSTVLAAGTWLLVARGVVPAAVPGFPRRGAARLLAAVCFLACWLPFNLGVRPEAYVAFGLTAVVALLWRARTLWALGAAVLVAGVSVTASPAAVMLVAPVLVFAPKIVRIVAAGTTRRREIVARVLVLCCLGGAALAVVFADQSWHTVAVATVWHTRFGPSLPWYDEFARYRYLLGADQDGSATKRLPVLLTLTLLPIVGLLLARNGEPTSSSAHPEWARSSAVAPPEPVAKAGDAVLIISGVVRLSAMVVLGLGSLWLAPSKWTHYFGALAGLFAAFLVVAIVVLARCARRPELVDSAPPPRVAAGITTRGGVTDPVLPWVGLCGSGVVAVAIGLAFSGPNAWWQPAVYDVPWARMAITPAGVPLNSPLLWAGVVVVGVVVIGRRRGIAAARHALIAGPAVLALAAATVAVAVLLGSFIAAPLRQPSGSLALSNIHRLVGHPSCGLGDDVQVLPDVAGSVMAPAGEDPGKVSGFIAGGGYDQGAPPPDPPGVGTSTQLWGSLAGPTGAANTATLTSPWFRLPAVAGDQEVTVSVAGRSSAGNTLELEFGHAVPEGAVTPLGRRTPPDPLRAEPGQPPQYRLWRSVGVAAAQVPTGSDRVRIVAVDASADPDGWLAVTGPRLRHIVALPRYLAEHSPVLVAWPIAYLFPCATHLVAVHDGLAQAPVSVLEAPQQYSGLGAATTDPTIGGNYAPLRELGGLGEVTTRLAGSPDSDWGDLLLTNYPAARDTYTVATTWAKVSGLHSDDTPPPPSVRASIP